MVRPPGTILQHMYFKERLKRVPAGRFVEIGVGEGALSALLLEMGWTGTGYELNERTLDIAASVNRRHVEQGRYVLKNEDWLNTPRDAPVDLIVSCMVLEHLNDEDERRYLVKCRDELSNTGVAVLFVPAGARYWGVEDEIAGHFRRYSFEDMAKKCESAGLNVRHMTGLTYPLSNLLLPITEFLVARQEADKAALSMSERSRASRSRNVKFKTTFPPLLSVVLNEYVLYPFHLVQKLLGNSPGAMLLYVEGVLGNNRTSSPLPRQVQ